MKEIGSEFYYSIKDIAAQGNHNLEDYLNLDKNNFIYLNSGRSCIKYLLKYFANNKREGKILLPSFLCESMIQPFEEMNFAYGFYNITNELKVDLASLKNLIDSDTMGILFINYFGFWQERETLEFIEDVKNEGLIIIEDATQSLFSGRHYGDFVIASLRKWFGLPDGGILINRTSEEVFNFQIQSGYDDFSTYRLIGHLIKNEYINNKILEKDYMLNCFNFGEEYLDGRIEIKEISPISKNLLSKYNYDDIKNKRRENYKVLYEGLVEIEKIDILFKMKDYEIFPLGFPVVYEDRDNLRRYLTSKGIYCPVHWPVPVEVDKDIFQDAYKLADRIITIPCDQRYNTEDMKYIVENVKQYFKGM